MTGCGVWCASLCVWVVGEGLPATGGHALLPLGQGGKDWVSGLGGWGGMHLSFAGQDGWSF
jgi:hypothetical protein